MNFDIRSILPLLFIILLLSCGNQGKNKSISDNNRTPPPSPIQTSKENAAEVIKKENIVKNKSIDNIDRGADNTKAINQEHRTLKLAYKSYFPIGVAVPANQLSNKRLTNLIASQFSSITPENEMKPKFLQAEEGDFRFDMADKIVSFARENKMRIRGHTLVWPQMMPKWMYYNGKNLASKDLFLKRLKKHITHTMHHFEGKVYCWDVVNEAIPYFGSDKMDSRKDLMLEIAGEEYFEKAFKFAREADPNAKLYYNDNGLENRKKRNKIYEFLKKMKQKGVPIDGMGMQAHWGIEGISSQYLQETIDMFYSIGLEVQLTELDISIYKKRGRGGVLRARDLTGIDETFTKEIESKQAEIYKTIFEVCRKSKGKVTGITLWSAYDWPNYLTKTLGKKNYPYLFDEKLEPKKAFYEVANF